MKTLKTLLLSTLFVIALPINMAAKVVKHPRVRHLRVQTKIARKHVLKHVGMASYYSYQHEGKRMANGKPFRRRLMTAAHNTLPFGTLIRVFNLRNGKCVDVEITDRGPHVKGRILDLSEAAAKAIDLKRFGIGKVAWTKLPEPQV